MRTLPKPLASSCDGQAAGYAESWLVCERVSRGAVDNGNMPGSRTVANSVG